MTAPDREWLEKSYEAFADIEEEFQAALDVSLEPRGPEILYELVSAWQLRPGSLALDVGCGDGKHSLELAERFDLDVLGIDPLPRHVELARARVPSRLEGRMSFEVGVAEALPVADESVALVWCRDVLVHVTDLGQVYREFHRTLRPGGRALVYQMFGTERLEAREGEWLWKAMGVVPQSAVPSRTEAAIATAGLRIDECIGIGSEWGEWRDEHGAARPFLVHVARLLRDPDRYVARFGEGAYEIMLGDCLWHVYGMIGKLERRAYLLSKR